MSIHLRLSIHLMSIHLCLKKIFRLATLAKNIPFKFFASLRSSYVPKFKT